MQPRLLDIPAKTILGIGANYVPILSEQSNAAEVIGPLWDRFNARRNEITFADPGVTYGVSTAIEDKNSMTHQAELRYIAGAEVSPLRGIPEGFEIVQIPAGLYAVFTHKGLIRDLGPSIKFAYSHWIPRSGRKIRNAPHFELYDARFLHDSPDSELDICIPVT